MNFFTQRDQLVRTLIKDGIRDQSVINAMMCVPRHLFVPESEVERSYANNPLDIGYKQTISQPYIVAFMTEAAVLEKSSRVLEIGTGSGYQAAILANICKEVYSIEIVEGLAIKAKRLFEDLKYKNIHTKIDDGGDGWMEHAPFDAILVTAAAKKLPIKLVSQLIVGGRMIIPLRSDYGSYNDSDVYDEDVDKAYDNSQILVKITKVSSSDDYTVEKLLSVIFVPLVQKPILCSGN